MSRKDKRACVHVCVCACIRVCVCAYVEGKAEYFAITKGYEPGAL